MNDYFTLEQAECYAFFRIPKRLIRDKSYNGLPIDAALLYAVLLDRMELSRKNHWVDESGHVYLYFPVKELCEELGFCKEKVCKLLSALERHDLLERRRQGLGKPDLLFLKQF